MSPAVYTTRCAKSIGQQVLQRFLAWKVFICYVTRAMREIQASTRGGSRFAATDPVAVERVGMRLVRLPLREAFATSFGRIHSRLIFLVWIEANGLTGWGEVVAAEQPRYSYETIGTASHVIRDYLAQSLMVRPVAALTDLAARFAPFKGHNMAKAGLELAYMDLSARIQDMSLSE